MGTMKKRMLALLLTLTIIVGLGGQAWAEVLPSVVSPAPEESTAVEDGAQPTDQVQSEPEGTTSVEEEAQPTDQVQSEPEASPTVPEVTGQGTDSMQSVQNAGVASRTLTIPSGEPVFPEHTIGGLSPAGTNIDLFDYWIWNQGDADNRENKGTEFLSSGINNNHALIFGKSLEGNDNGIGAWNQWTRSASPYTGIVASKLGEDGYPQLNLDLTTATAHAGKDGQESLAYLFDPKMESQGKESFSDVQGLLQMDDQGYYHYDSRENYAVYFENKNSFVLYKYPGVQDVHKKLNGQFFPFNAVGPDNLPPDPGNYFFPKRTPEDENLNHYFGLHMTTQFVQQNEGHTDHSKTQEVTYQFSGDDDVWIFIDGILVADLGGIHGRATVDINFVTGVIKVNGTDQDKTLGELFGGGEGTLPNNTFHTLDFFYLERGNVESNMSLKYNLVSVPESSIIKVDQTGEPVSGVGFELYLADRGYQKQENPIAAGSTDSRGQLVLLDEMGNVISLQEIWTKMNSLGLLYGSNGEQRGNLVLRETGKPEGYRSAGDVHLYLVSQNENILLLSDNSWDTGAYAYTNSTVVMDGTVTYGTEQSAELERGGTLFAVVLRRTTHVGESAPTMEDDWGLMTGSATDGWHTGQPLKDDQSGVEQVLEELQKAENQENYFVAQPDSGENYAITVTNLPGEITSYYYLLGETEKQNTEYTVGFYYTKASSVQNATIENTWRVQNSDKWSRVFSANVHVPNIKNRIFVQKLAPDGTAVAGAEFTLYRDAACKDTVGILTTMNLNKEQHGIRLDGAGVYPIGDAVLANGTYYLKETAAPDGYTINPKVTKIIVDDTGVYADAGAADDGIVVARGVGSIVKSMAQFASLGDIDVTLNNIVAKFYTVPSSYISETTQDFSGLIWREESDGAFVANQGVSYHPTYMYDAAEGTLELYNEETSEDKTSMGMHMQYSTQAGLEYDPGESIKDVLGDEAVHWMTTDTGWSKLMMEQCLTHSQEMQKEGYHVTDLTSPTLYDLTNLFSGTVIVQVTDQHTTSLTINKQVQGVKDPEVAGQLYTFKVEKLETDGQSVDEGYTGEVTVRQDGEDTKDQFQSGVLEVSRQGVGDIQVLGLENGRYRVTETDHGSDEVGGTRWQSAAYTTTSHNVTFASGTPVADISSYAADTATAAVQVTNLYAGAQPLIVTKTVGGTMGDTSQDFTFTLSLQDKQGTPFKEDITAIKSGAGLDDPVLLPLTSEENYSFTLKHGQRIFIQIPYGSQKVVVTETAEIEYTTKSRHYKSGTTPPVYTANVAEQTIATMDSGYTVDFYNERNLGAPPSGVAPMSPGYTVMLWVGGASALVIFGCSFLVWRRRRRDWM